MPDTPLSQSEIDAFVNRNRKPAVTPAFQEPNAIGMMLGTKPGQAALKPVVNTLSAAKYIDDSVGSPVGKAASALNNIPQESGMTSNPGYTLTGLLSKGLRGLQSGALGAGLAASNLQNPIKGAVENIKSDQPKLWGSVINRFGGDASQGFGKLAAGFGNVVLDPLLLAKPFSLTDKGVEATKALGAGESLGTL